MPSTDITGKIGNMFQGEQPEWPMYSFNRPAYAFWQGVATELQEQGYSQQHIQGVLQSKHMRWLFDGGTSEEIEAVGRAVTKAMHTSWKL